VIGGISTVNDKILFGETLRTGAKALNLRAQRHDMIVSNLANADTPGYKAFDLMVEESIQKQSGSESQIALKRTHPGHLPTARARGTGIRPEIIRLPEQNNLRGDGNTVDMDREMSNLAGNQLLYRASVQIVAKKFQDLKNVISGGK
jgi:flagellar basal-body rod protein FlgB